MKVKATATRSGDWWVVEVVSDGEGLRALCTQARRLDQVREMALDVAAVTWQVPVPDLEVEVVPVLSETVLCAVEAARTATQLADTAARDARRLTRQVVSLLRSEGLTMREVGAIMGVSPQRVSQLVDH